MTVRPSLLPCVLLFLLSTASGGCFAPTAEVDIFAAESFAPARYQTVGWASDSSALKTRGSLPDDVGRWISETAEEALAARGLVRVDPERADLLARAVVGVETLEKPYAVFSYPGQSFGNRPDTYTYENGTLAIELFDAETQTLVWAGEIQDRVFPRTGAKATRRAVRELIDRLPAQFGTAAAAGEG